jgi:hypothetical protein
LSHSANKEADAKKMGADHFILTKDEEVFETFGGSNKPKSTLEVLGDISPVFSQLVLASKSAELVYTAMEGYPMINPLMAKQNERKKIIELDKMGELNKEDYAVDNELSQSDKVMSTALGITGMASTVLSFTPFGLQQSLQSEIYKQQRKNEKKYKVRKFEIYANPLIINTPKGEEKNNTTNNKK